LSSGQRRNVVGTTSHPRPVLPVLDAVAVHSSQVLAVVDLLAAEGIVGWLDGGWGVDALLGERTRQHSDLDLVDAYALVRLLELLADDGFTVLRDDLPVAIAVRHGDGREIDLHPVELTADGGGDQQQPGGTAPFHYGPPTTGQVAGRPVPCCGLDTQLRSHLGYPPDEDDLVDMRALARRFRCPLPTPYDHLVIYLGLVALLVTSLLPFVINKGGLPAGHRGAHAAARPHRLAEPGDGP
jgi:lincosamide nucleotidyltransferase A/C/D/E